MTSYTNHWEEKFSNRKWGSYPPEDLIRFVKRVSFHGLMPEVSSVLELGCGPGANLPFLLEEGYRVSGIDISESAIQIAEKKLKRLPFFHEDKVDLRSGNFQDLPWASDSFDLIIDNFAVYANTLDVITRVLAETYRVMKHGGWGFSKFWGTKTTGFGTGLLLEANTFDCIEEGPCADMGVTHFCDEAELKNFFYRFSELHIDHLERTDVFKGHQIEEFACYYKK